MCQSGRIHSNNMFCIFFLFISSTKIFAKWTLANERAQKIKHSLNEDVKHSKIIMNKLKNAIFALSFAIVVVAKRKCVKRVWFICIKQFYVFFCAVHDLSRHSHSVKYNIYCGFSYVPFFWWHFSLRFRDTCKA